MALPQIVVRVAFTTDPLDPAPSWTTISTYTDDYSINIGKQAELDAYQPGTASLVLKNDDRRFDPTHTTSPYYPNVQPRKLLSIQAIWAGVTYDLYYGFVDGWNQRPNGLGVQSMGISCTDLFAILENINLPLSVFALEIDTDGPKAWWPLTETAGTAMVEVAAGRDGSYSPTIRNTEPGLYSYSDRSAIAFDGADYGEVTDSTVATAAGGDATFEMVVQFDEDSSLLASNPVPFFHQRGPTASQEMYARLDQLGGIDFLISATGVRSLAGSSVNIRDGQPHLLTFRRSGSTNTLWLDGVLQTTPITNVLPTSTGTGVRIHGGYTDSTVTVPTTMGDVATYESALSDARILAHYEAWSAPWDGDTTGERVQRIADIVGLDATQVNIDTGQSTLGPTALNVSALSKLREIEATEQGNLYVDHADGGKLRFESRHQRLTASRSTTVQATFTDEDTPGTIHVERGSIEVLWDWQLIYNEVIVSFGGGTVTVTDATSIADYGRRTLSLDTDLRTAAEARALGEWVLSHYKDPIARIQSLTLNPAGDDTSAAMALGLRLGDLVEVKLKPQNVGSRNTYRLLVEGKQHDISKADGKWTTTLYLSPAEAKTYAIWGSGLWDSAIWGY